jgi:hypothetical protein
MTYPLVMVLMAQDMIRLTGETVLTAMIRITSGAREMILEHQVSTASILFILHPSFLILYFC